MKRPLLISLTYLFLVSCLTQKPNSTAVNPYEIKKVGIIVPTSIIEVYNSKNEDKNISGDYYEDEIKSYAQAAQVNFLKRTNIEAEPLELINEEANLIQNEVGNYFNIMTEKGQKKPQNFNFDEDKSLLQGIRVTDSLANILRSKNLRFALATITVGFTRNKKNERNRKIGNVATIALGVGMAVLTGYGLIGRGVPYATTTYFFLIDAERQKLCMYNVKMAETDPTNKNSLQGQIALGLGDYWNHKEKKE